MAAVLLIIDGMTDDQVPELGGKTPFEFAQCRNMSTMRLKGAFGFLRTCPEYFQAESMTCILTLLGLSPAQIPSHARAYFETVARGIPVEQEDLIVRCNLVRVDQNEILQSACADGFSVDQMELATLQAAKLLPDGETKFYRLGGYKNLIVIKGCAREVDQIITFAPHEHCGQSIKNLLPTGTPAARQLAKFAQQSAETLQNYGGMNAMLLPWGQARSQLLPSFYNLHHQTAAAVCATEIVRGMTLCMGMETPVLAGATADTDTDLNAKAQAAIQLLQKYPFVLVHVNGADEAAHRRHPLEKAEFLKRIDSILVDRLMNETDAKILVCADHSTLSLSGKHRGEPQQFLLFRSHFSGDLGNLDGTQAVSLLFH